LKQDPSYKTLNLITAAFWILLVSIAAIFSSKVEHWQVVVLEMTVAGVVVLAGNWIHAQRGGWIGPASRATSILLFYAIAFSAVAPLQHILFDQWMDQILISLDQYLLGMEASLLLEHWIHPVLTEWMMFSYVAYVPLLPLTAIVCYCLAGEKSLNSYLLNLSLAYILCYIGFILFPVATQMHFIRELYTTPLDGWAFSWFAEWMRTNLHPPGEALPSPHCAAATVMLVMFYRYGRVYFYWILPIILTLYVSTVYGRYHYSWDAVAGIVVAIAVLRTSPLIVNQVNKIFADSTNAMKPPIQP